MSITDRLNWLLERVGTSQASAEELEELIGLIDADPAGDIVRNVNAFHEADSIAPIPYDVSYWRTVLQEVLVAGKSIEGSYIEEDAATPVMAPVHRVHFLRRYRWWAAAAGIILFLGVGAYFYFNQKPGSEVAKTPAAKKMKNDVAPGGNKAILTLANGSNITLDSAANGELAQQGNSVINKTKDGELKYEPAIPGKPGEAGKPQLAIVYNTLATPRGGQYQLVLPDGSRVWLNAASSIRYPTAFTGNERKVEITGEAYFEVAPVRLRSGQKMPFIVQEGGMSVQVLGTHFNVNGYEDEDAVRTTLLEGSVKVSKDDVYVLLKPGEQTSLSHSSNLSQPIPVQTDEVMAWKNGQFAFRDATIESIMRQAARWYDVDVVYDATITKHFIANIPRSVPLSELLKVLELTDQVHFKVQGRKITVIQ